MSKRNAVAVIVDDLPFDAPPGHLAYRRDVAGQIVGMSFGCPCGCKRTYGATFAPNRWSFDGNVETPTVTPSLGCYPTKGNSFHWHGYLRAGVFEEC